MRLVTFLALLFSIIGKSQTDSLIWYPKKTFDPMLQYGGESVIDLNDGTYLVTGQNLVSPDSGIFTLQPKFYIVNKALDIIDSIKRNHFDNNEYEIENCARINNKVFCSGIHKLEPNGDGNAALIILNLKTDSIYCKNIGASHLIPKNAGGKDFGRFIKILNDSLVVIKAQSRPIYISPDSSIGWPTYSLGLIVLDTIGNVVARKSHFLDETLSKNKTCSPYSGWEVSEGNIFIVTGRDTIVKLNQELNVVSIIKNSFVQDLIKKDNGNIMGISIREDSTFTYTFSNNLDLLDSSFVFNETYWPYRIISNGQFSYSLGIFPNKFNTVGCNIYNFDFDCSRFSIVKYDSNFAEVWQKTFIGPDKGLIIDGLLFSNTDFQIFDFKFSENGSLLIFGNLFSRFGPFPNFDYLYGNFILEISSEGAIVSTQKLKPDDIKFNIYPNPTAEIIILPQNAQLNRLEVYDVAGKLVISENIKGKTQTSLQGLQNGLYFIRLFGENGYFGASKIIKSQPHD